MQTIIDMQGINKSYEMGGESLHVLKDINFTVEKGEFVAILGPSGSGKSTLMNIIGCMDHSDTGTYLLNDEPIHAYNDKQLGSVRNRYIGFVFQKYHLIQSYTVGQNIIIPLLIRGMKYKQALEKSWPIIKMLGLGERISHHPNELSGGQQQRVAIARALTTRPAILLADEPTGALDGKTGREVLQLFEQLNSIGNTIVMITHDVNVAQKARRVVRIIDGELFEGATETSNASVAASKA